MNILSPPEVGNSYCAAGKAKVERPIPRMFVLAMLAGFIIAMGAVLSNTVTHTITDVSTSRMISGLFFAFGLPIVMLTGAELFTGNNLICISCYAKETSLGGMFRNWGIVYLGNFVGSILVAAACVYAGQFNYSSGGLAVATIKTAIAKCSLSFGPAVVLGLLCNMLVCTAVLCSLSAKDTVGRILGAYIPVVIFVCAGFEHSIANMYYIPAGIFAMGNPEYAALAVDAGLNTGALTWGNFFLHNLIPVTIGNIIGGVLMGTLMWFCHTKPARDAK